MVCLTRMYVLHDEQCTSDHKFGKYIAIQLKPSSVNIKWKPARIIGRIIISQF